MVVGIVSQGYGWGLQSAYANRILCNNANRIGGNVDARAYWDDYVERQGGLQATATRLRTPYSTVACISNGSRGIGRVLARRFAEADPDLDETVLVWVTPNADTQLFGEPAKREVA